MDRLWLHTCILRLHDVVLLGQYLDSIISHRVYPRSTSLLSTNLPTPTALRSGDDQ
jgi:hypothetical protein